MKSEPSGLRRAIGTSGPSKSRRIVMVKETRGALVYLRDESLRLTKFAFLLLIASASAQFEFGSMEHPGSPEKTLIVEDFTSVPEGEQLPVKVMYLDVGSVRGIYDVEDPLYLHVGQGPVKIADIRLTNSTYGRVGSRVGPTDEDLGLDLWAFSPPYPRLVYGDFGDVAGAYDRNDSVYVKSVPPISKVAVGDVRLTWAYGLPPGTMVNSSDPDRGAGVGLLHPGPDFAVWSPLARGQVRFYNANGNVFEDQLSLPVYDASDGVYFDVSIPSDPPRLFGYVAVPPGTGAIGDFVWWDLNENGIQDDGNDSGIPGVEVLLFDSGGRLIETCETDGNGSYLFDGLYSGYFYVCVDISTLPERDDGAQWWPTEPNVGGNDSMDSDGVLVDEDDPLG